MKNVLQRLGRVFAEILVYLLFIFLIVLGVVIIYAVAFLILDEFGGEYGTFLLVITVGAMILTIIRLMIRPPITEWGKSDMLFLELSLYASLYTLYTAVYLWGHKWMFIGIYMLYLLTFVMFALLEDDR